VAGTWNWKTFNANAYWTAANWTEGTLPSGTDITLNFVGAVPGTTATRTLYLSPEGTNPVVVTGVKKLVIQDTDTATVSRISLTSSVDGSSLVMGTTDGTIPEIQCVTDFTAPTRLAAYSGLRKTGAGKLMLNPYADALRGALYVDAGDFALTATSTELSQITGVVFSGTGTCSTLPSGARECFRSVPVVHNSSTTLTSSSNATFFGSIAGSGNFSSTAQLYLGYDGQDLSAQYGGTLTALYVDYRNVGTWTVTGSVRLDKQSAGVVILKGASAALNNTTACTVDVDATFRMDPGPGVVRTYATPLNIGGTLQVSSGVVTQSGVLTTLAANTATPTLRVASGATLTCNTTSAWAFGDSTYNNPLTLDVAGELYLTSATAGSFGGNEFYVDRTGSGTVYFRMREPTGNSGVVRTVSLAGRNVVLESSTYTLPYANVEVRGTLELGSATSAAGSLTTHVALSVAEGGQVVNKSNVLMTVALTNNASTASSYTSDVRGVLGGASAPENNIAVQVGSGTVKIYGTKTYTGDTHVNTATSRLRGVGTLAGRVRLTDGTIAGGTTDSPGDLIVPSIIRGTSTAVGRLEGAVNTPYDYRDAATSHVVCSGTATLGSIQVQGGGSGWLPGVEYVVFESAQPISNTTLGVATWNDATYPRIGGGTVRKSADGKQLLLTPANSYAIPFWAGGVDGVLTNGGTGVEGSGATPHRFFNGDVLRVDSRNSTTINLSESLVFRSIDFYAGQPHTIIADANKPQVVETNVNVYAEAGFTQNQEVTIDAPLVFSATSGSIYSAQVATTVRVKKPWSLGPSASAATHLSLYQNTLVFDFGADVTWAVPLYARWGTVRLTGGSNTTLTAPVLSSSTSGYPMTLAGSGVLTLSPSTSSPSSAFFVQGAYILDGAGENPAKTVLRTPGYTTADSGLVINARLGITNGAVYETLAPTFTRPLVSSVTTPAGFWVTGGGGFSARAPTGLTVSNSGTTWTMGSGEGQWGGPMYFGTSLGTSQGTVTVAANLTIPGTTPLQKFHVFNGVNGAKGYAKLTGVIAANGGIQKTGPGTLEITNTSNSLTYVLISEGTLRVATTAAMSPVKGVDLTLEPGGSLQIVSGLAPKVNNFVTGGGTVIFGGD